jgi:FtsP/CotA-like multicopper oxidase with cupredoxin domain
MRNKAAILSILAAIVLLMAKSVSAQSVVDYDLIMRNVSTATMWDGKVVNIFGFAPNILNAWLPGPTLVANEGDTLNVFVWNISQGAPHTVHWHGMDVDQANDGVPHTSFSLGHMEDTNYVFVAQHAGTYMYHCHVHGIVHVQMGMYGPLIVRPADGSKRAWTGGPSYHSDMMWLTSELDSYWHDTLAEEPVIHPDSLHDEVEVPVYAPDYFLVNGLSETQLDSSKTAINAREAERVYLRLANMGYYMNRYVFPSVLNATVLDSDGRPLPDSIRTDTLEVMPGERYGVMLTPTGRFDTVVQVDYMDLFNFEVKSTQWVPVHVRGHVAIDEANASSSLKVYPNPAAGRLNISWEEAASKPESIRIMDLSGRVLLTPLPKNQISAIQTIDISSLPSGIYLLQMETAIGSSHHRVVVSNGQ